jgi:hypothetical protein
MLPFAPQFLGQVRINLGQTQGIVTAKIIDDAGNPIQGIEMVVIGPTGGLINDPSGGLYKSDANGIVTITVPETGKLIDLNPRGAEWSGNKTVRSAPSPGPAPVIFTIPRNIAPSSQEAQGSSSGKTNKGTLILGGLALAAIAGGIIYFSARP